MEAFADWKHGGISITSDKVSVKDYLASWLKIMESSLAPHSLANYASRIKTINSYIGSVQLQELRPRDVDGMLVRMSRTGAAHATIEKTKNILHSALQYAVYPAELIVANPAAAIKVPKGSPKEVTPRYIITAERMDALMEKYPFGHPLHVPFMLAYYTGMRIGEILGLSWDDVDFEQGSLHIKQQLSRINGVGTVLAPPKTESSVRLILIDSDLLNLLRRWKSHQEALEMLEDDYCFVYADENKVLSNISDTLSAPAGMRRVHLVCTDLTGCYISHARLFYCVQKEGLNMHSFRHTHATLLAENGAQAKDVAARLGQKNVDVTLNVYTHVTDTMRQNTRDIIESINKKHADK